MKKIAVTFLLLMIAPLPAFASSSPSLSPQQHARLEQGDIVLLDALPPGGDLKRSQGGTVVAVVKTSPVTVWEVLVDWERHAGLFPRVVNAEVVESAPAHTLVRYTIGLGPLSFGFHVNNYPDRDQRRLTWRLATDRRNDLFRDSWGYWQLAHDPLGTMLTYAMGARTVLPQFLTRGAERDGLVETIKAVRARAEHVRPEKSQTRPVVSQFGLRAPSAERWKRPRSGDRGRRTR
jgi:ribosome-associated toxin RatA of RatAB toxin-antitoxin module